MNSVYYYFRSFTCNSSLFIQSQIIFNSNQFVVKAIVLWLVFWIAFILSVHTAYLVLKARLDFLNSLICISNTLIRNKTVMGTSDLYHMVFNLRANAAIYLNLMANQRLRKRFYSPTRQTISLDQFMIRTPSKARTKSLMNYLINPLNLLYIIAQLQYIRPQVPKLYVLVKLALTLMVCVCECFRENCGVICILQGMSITLH